MISNVSPGDVISVSNFNIIWDSQTFTSEDSEVRVQVGFTLAVLKIGCAQTVILSQCIGVQVQQVPHKT